MRYLSVCSGIEAATVAWEPLGWKPVAFSEIESFPSAVLAHHYPDVPNLGDMTKIDGTKLKGKVDVIVGGTPCQSFSVAGLRAGMADPRGNLALSFLRLVDEIRPRFFIWENVPGVLSSSGGRDFGSFVGAVAELGYRGAWRVLDAQYFGLAQRRKRVFFVGCSPESGVDPAEVLFERESLCGDSAPSREKREGVADGPTHSLRGEGFDASEEGTGRGTPLVSQAGYRMSAFGQYEDDDTASTVKSRDYKDATDLVAASTLRMRAGCEGGGKGALVSEEQSLTLASANDQTVFAPLPFDARQSDVLQYGDKTGPLDTDGHSIGVKQGYTVRRLTPIECERLQGFPDGYTQIPWKGKEPEDCPDGPRYKALGNSMAVPVMQWIGGRLDEHKA